MEEYCFRVWDYASKKMIYDVTEPDIIFKKSINHDVMEGCWATDDRGTEIYEGDIVRCSGRDRMARWNDVFVVSLGDWAHMCEMADAAETVVIGNVYQNPELLVEKQEGHTEKEHMYC